MEISATDNCSNPRHITAWERGDVRLVVNSQPETSTGREGSITLTLKRVGQPPVEILLDDVTTLQLAQVLRATLTQAAVASSVYSHRLISSSNVAATPSYTVPDGFVAVVRTITIWPFVAGSGFQIFLEDETASLVLWMQLTVGTVDTFEHDTRLVFETGSTFALSTNYTGTMHGSVHGYLLSTP